jgi:heat-inducible transcriptional repressor
VNEQDAVRTADLDDVGTTSVPVAPGLLADAVTAAADAAAAADDAPPLDGRKLRVLRAVVSEYVASGEPVGSRRVVEAAQLDVSAATVRNEMAALEELGYIAQPHTSAGRVPTDRGYRRFVDDLANDPALDGPERELIQELLGSARDVEDLLARTSSVLSQLTRLVSLVIAPAVDASRCKLIELVALTPGSALLLLVADTGRVEKRTVDLPAGTTDHDLERVRAVVGEHVRSRPMGQVQATLWSLVDTAPSDLRELVRSVAAAADDDLADATVHHVFVGGRASLAGEAALERGELSRVLQLLEERATLARLLAETSGTSEADVPTVRIGGENEVEDLRATSLVAQRYRVVSAGSLGVLGPTRMDYAAVLGTVRAVADQLQRTLSDLSR